uniref:Uncharacterized protein n=1 Tax=Arundo donax TaxID=35708 RepID=A0A0A9BAJ5_ARUDO
MCVVWSQGKVEEESIQPAVGATPKHDAARPNIHTMPTGGGQAFLAFMVPRYLR